MGTTPVALKTITGNINDKKSIALFIKEATLHYSERLEGIVKIYGIWIQKKYPYMVLDLMECSLQDLIETPVAWAKVFFVHFFFFEHHFPFFGVFIFRKYLKINPLRFPSEKNSSNFQSWPTLYLVFMTARQPSSIGTSKATIFWFLRRAIGS